MNNVIAKFEYNNKTYVYFLKEDKNIYFGYFLNGIIIDNLSEDEIKMMKIISRQIFISHGMKNHIELGTTKHNEKTFRILFDKISKLKFFYEIKENSYFFPCIEDADYLIRIFNTIPAYISNEDIKLKPIFEKKKFFEKVVVFSKKVIIVTFISLIAFSALDVALAQQHGYEGELKYKQTTTGGMFLYEGSGETKDVEEEYSVMESTTEFSIDDITQAINNNIKLSQQEKDFMLGYLNILIKYKKYVNNDSIVNILKNIDFSYHSEYNPECAGNWNLSTYTMNYFDATSFDATKYSVKSHEGYHAISYESNPYDLILGSAFSEGMTEILAEESSYGTKGFYKTYNHQTTYIRMLCEITGAEPLMASYISGDRRYILNALCDIIPNEEMAYKFLSDLDTDMVYGDLPAMTGDVEEYHDEVKEETKNNIFYALSGYFLIKYGYPITLDAIEMMYYSKICSYHIPISVEYLGENDIGSFFVNKTDILKGYFINDCIKDFPDFTVLYSTWKVVQEDEIFEGVPNEQIITINDENRRMMPITDTDGNYFLIAGLDDSKKQKD